MKEVITNPSISVYHSWIKDIALYMNYNKINKFLDIFYYIFYYISYNF